MGTSGRSVSDDKVERALIGLRRGMTVRAAAAFGGMHRSTLYRMIAADATLATEVEKAIDAGEAFHTNVVFEAAEKNWQASAWWLERRMHREYGRHDKIDLSVDVRAEAERLAAATGLSVEEIIAEAEAVLAGKS